MPFRYRSWLVLALFILVCLSVGAIGGAFTGASLQEWYPTLRKPSWTAPPIVFGPVWTVLYILMAIAAWLVWRCRGVVDATNALYLFAAQLAFNLAWSAFFFGLRSPAPRSSSSSCCGRSSSRRSSRSGASAVSPARSSSLTSCGPRTP